jgi:hypothetical protein
VQFHADKAPVSRSRQRYGNQAKGTALDAPLSARQDFFVYLQFLTGIVARLPVIYHRPPILSQVNS